MPSSLSAVRLQAALVRALLDEIDHSLPAGAEAELAAQLADELDRLAGRLREGAQAVRASIPPEPTESGPLTVDSKTRCA